MHPSSHGLPRPEYIHNMPYSLKPNIPTVFQFSNIHIKYAKWKME
jgi:hypothetical protein